MALIFSDSIISDIKGCLKFFINMKSLFINIKNLLPYLLLVAIYFFFVNIEARNNVNRYEKNSKVIKKNNNTNDANSADNNYNERIAIPVLPFKP